MPLPDRLTRFLPLAAFALALAAALWRAPVALPTQPEPRAPITLRTTNEVSREWLPESAAGTQLSLAQLADGRLVAAWTQAGDNQAIAFSRRERDGWQKPWLIATRESTAGSNFAYVNRLDAPLLHVEGGWLHLWYATHPFDSSRLPQLQHQISTDGGQHWQAPRRQPTAPFGGGAPSGTALPLADGGLSLELQAGSTASRLRLASTGQILDLNRLPESDPVLHQVSLDLPGQQVLGLLRTAATENLQRWLSDNAGQSWTATAASDLKLAPTPFAVLRLHDGRLLLAGNPPSGTGSLQLWLSSDQGEHWQVAKTVEQAADGAADFRAPRLLTLRDGRLLLAYPDRQRGWRLIGFGLDWLDGGRA